MAVSANVEISDIYILWTFATFSNHEWLLKIKGSARI